jgi:ABC-type transporter Mla subunit MlaD
VAIATLQLDAAARGVVKSDVTAAVEPRSALNDETIDLSPGSASAPAATDGMTIPAARTSGAVALDRITAVIDADTRAQLAVILDQLHEGVGGRAAPLSAALARLGTLVDPATRVATTLAHRRLLLSDFVSELSDLAAVAAHHDGALAHAIASGFATLRTFAGQQHALAGSVRLLPRTTTTLDGALDSVAALAIPLAPALRSLQTTASALPQTLAAAQRITAPAGRLLGAAQALALVGAGPLRSAAALFAQLRVTTAALTPAVAELQPVVAAIDQHRTGIGLLGERFSGVMSTSDANGAVIRGLGTFEPFDPADFGYAHASLVQKETLEAQAARALTLTCRHGGLVACLVRYLVPGLPGAVR